MTTEFNLSKSRALVKQILQGVYTGSENHRIIELIFANVETQDKEFIRLLKEEFCYPNEGICKLCKKETFVNMDCDCFECVIDKLAGDKLKTLGEKEQ
jgi:hypothetical protein